MRALCSRQYTSGPLAGQTVFLDLDFDGPVQAGFVRYGDSYHETVACVCHKLPEVQLRFWAGFWLCAALVMSVLTLAKFVFAATL